MGLLDDLKQQAESRKQEELTNRAEKSRCLQAVHGALRATFQYFTELANSLNILKPDVSRTFYVEGSTRFENLTVSNFRVRDRRGTIDHRDYLEEVALRFDWAGREPLVAERESPPLTQRLREHLAGYGMRFQFKDIKNERGVVIRTVFTVEPAIIATASFSGNWDTGIIRLSLKNVETLGTIDYQYDAAEIDQALLDELTKLVLGKPNNLKNLGKYQELLRTTPRLRTDVPDVKYAIDPTPEAGSGNGLLNNLKSLLKR